MDLNTYMNEKRAMIDTALKDALHPERGRPSLLHEAMRYSVMNGGKRIRPILCMAAAEPFGTPAQAALPAAISLELFHCSTLIHDDLPCMDDDDLRRGQPTCHIKYGEANAVLTGDALMIQAFQMLAEGGKPTLALELARAAGSCGVIAGQMEDLAAEGREADPKLLDFIHYHKTAILIRAAVRMGALVGGAREDELEALGLFGEKIGIAFQIEDDILDETSTDEVLGKHAGADQERNKMTYPAVHGMDAAKATVARLTDEALASLELLSRDTSTLQAIARYLMNREF